MYKVYWIKNKEMKNPFKEGYIGITSKDINERFEQHMNNPNNKFYNLNNLYIVEIDSFESPNEAYTLEMEYRPKNNIGWNIAKVGLEFYLIIRNSIMIYHLMF